MSYYEIGLLKQKLLKMIPESDDASRKIVQSLLVGGESLVWAGKPGFWNVLLSSSPMVLLGLGLFFGIFAVTGFLHLDPTLDARFNNAPEYLYFGNVLEAVLGVLFGLGGPILACLIARGSVYGITSRRVLVVNRKSKRVIWESEVHKDCSVSFVCDSRGRGAVCFADSLSQDPIGLVYLDRAHVIAKLLAETFGIPLEQVTSMPSLRNVTTGLLQECLLHAYSLLGDKRGLFGAAAALMLWGVYMSVMWIWVGTIGFSGRSVILSLFILLFTIFVSAGLVVRLIYCFRK
ncbi:MAG: hypothetical protein K2X27_08170 [Candidatus Obscuribacterales bacterium]|nr:hypothetical protein [Candidatus Obscuribacterales bacterium]